MAPSMSTSGYEVSSNNREEAPMIQRFYSGASVLVTGATGFMGKVLIEKLLRSCPDIECVYMMVREKKGRSLEERIDDLVSSPCFDRIKKERPDFRAQLRAVAGDVGLEGLGLSWEHRHLLQQQVNIVFHMAASVGFDEHLKSAILQNVRGTREVLDLCRTFKNLRSVVHVSTAYSNCPEMQIDERFYDPWLPSDHVIRLAETTDVTTLDRLSHKLLGNWPNVHMFTKSLSEDVVRNHGQGLPIAVMRPSIVVSTAKEPMMGWIDNLSGPTGIMVTAAIGVLRTMKLGASCEANIVPCDMAVNAVIASAWDVAVNRIAVPDSSANTDTPVYNVVATKQNPITWESITDLFVNVIPVYSHLYMGVRLVAFNSRANYLLMRLLVHSLPAALAGGLLAATNRSPTLLTSYREVHRFTDEMDFFSTREWSFENKQLQRMWKDMHHDDRLMFDFDMDSLNWARFIYEAQPGIRMYLQ